MKKLGLIFASAVLLLLLSIQAVCAGEIDILVDKLVEKGILTAGEAQQIVTETKEQLRVEIASGEAPTGVPEWVEKVELGGDLRLRYERRSRKGDPERHRFRVRARAGIDADVTDNVTVGIGFASGSDDPRSTNATWDDSFDTMSLMLDYAYAEYEPFDWLGLVGGKFKRKGWIDEPADLLWDSDIRPEGVMAKLSNSPMDGVDLFLNTGALVLDESGGDTSDPYMIVVQPGLEWKFNDDIALDTTFAYYDFENVEGAVLANSEPGGNTREDQGFAHRPRATMPLIYDYNCLNVNAELKFNEPFGGFGGLIPYASVFGEYVHNTDPSSNRGGYLAGLKFGDKKVKKFGQWQLKYMYRHLEADAWVDIFPDSDVYDGMGTNIEAHEISLKYGLAKNWELGLDYYYTQPLSEISSAPYTYIMNPDDVEHLFQTDLVYKF